jgi:hypothetical protein
VGMKIEIVKPKIPHPVRTPFGIIDKNFGAFVRLDKSDDFSLEVEVQVSTGGESQNQRVGITFKKLTVIADDDAPLGVTTTHLRSFQLKQVLEAVAHAAIYEGTAKRSKSLPSTSKVFSPEQLKAASIVLDNPGKPHAQMISEALGIELQSARNLITRTRKSGLIPNARTTTPALPNTSILEMSAGGDYIDSVMEGRLPPISQRQYEENRKTKQKRKEMNDKKKK